MASTFNFDRVIPRRGTGSLKWDKSPELDPFWVADMDFTSPPAVLEVLQERVAHGVLGYALPHSGLTEALLEYMQKRHAVSVEENEIVHLGGLVCALSMIAQAIGEPGAKIMTCTPIYPPFMGVHHDADKKCITVPHIEIDGQWVFDWEAMEAAVTPDTAMFLLSNPQNPLGRVFTREELEELALFCDRHEMVLVSDEIHCDLILDEAQTPHICAAGLPDELQKRIITLLAPSKTYNIAGMSYAFAVIRDDSLRRKFTQIKGHTQPEIGCLSYYTAEAAYRHGEPWRQELLSYLTKNRDTVTNFVRTRMTGCKIPNIEATYLAWIDCRALEKENPANFFEKEAALYLSDGAYFGTPGHVRFNYGCSHSRMLEGLEKMANVIA